MSFAALLGAASSSSAAVVSYTFDWSQPAETYSQLSSNIGSFTTTGGVAHVTLPANTQDIILLGGTTDALSGGTGTYFDVKQGNVTIGITGGLYNKGSRPEASSTGGHLGLYGISSTASEQKDFYWHPLTGTAGHAGSRDHDAESNSNSTGALAYSSGNQPASLTISYNAGSDSYLYALAINGTTIYTRTVLGDDFDGRIDTLGLRYSGNTNSSQSPNSYAEFGTLTISGFLVPEPTATLLGGLCLLPLLRRRRN